MQNRTIEQVYSKELGNKAFARFLTLCKAENIEITDIREYYEKFKFKADGYEMEYQKNTKNIKGMFKMFLKCLEMRKELGFE